MSSPPAGSQSQTPLPAEAQCIQDFTTLTLKLGATLTRSQQWTQSFVRHYSEPHRRYHTLSHISSMWSSLRDKQILKPIVHTINDIDPDNVVLALSIFFHDWIYDPTRKDNEVASIREFERFAADINLDLNGTTCKRVKMFIECTITHTLPTATPPPVQDHHGTDDDGFTTTNNDEELLRWFLDADMEVLARSPREYQMYASQIRIEYGHYSDDDYRRGRVGVLKSFLRRERIYFSDLFVRCCEDKARENLRGEIVVLETSDSNDLPQPSYMMPSKTPKDMFER